MMLTLVFEQSDHTAGFYLTKPHLVKVPNIAAMESHVPNQVIHTMQRNYLRFLEGYLMVPW